MGYGGVGTKLYPTWLSKMVGAIYHTALYKDNSARPRNMVLTMPTTQYPAVCAKAVRIAITDILGCTTMIIYARRQHTILSQWLEVLALHIHFSSTSNIDQQNYAKQWHRMVIAYVNGLMVRRGQIYPA